MKKLLVIFIFLFQTSYTQVWNTVGLGIDSFSAGFVNSLYEYDSKLYVGHSVSGVNGGTIPSKEFGIWDSSSWYPSNLNSFVPQGVYCFDTLNGDLYMGGSFTHLNLNPYCRKVGRWDGTAWHPLGKGVTNTGAARVRTMASYNGSIFIGGNFIEVDSSIAASRIARWDGSAWHAMGTGFSSAFGIWSMQVYNNELFVGGEFNAIDGVPANNICRWNGSSWDSLGAGVDGIVRCMTVDIVNNKLYIGGEFFTANGLPAPSNVAIWDGNTLTPINASPYLFPHGMAMYDGKLFAAGGSNGLVNNLGDTIHDLAFYDGTNWQPACFQIDGTVQAMREYKNELYVGGVFNTINNINMYGIARYYNATVSVEEKAKQDDYITVIPNPAHGDVTITFGDGAPKNVTIELRDIAGRIVKLQRHIAYNSIKIITQDVKGGAYYLTILINNRELQKEKVIITGN